MQARAQHSAVMPAAAAAAARAELQLGNPRARRVLLTRGSAGLQGDTAGATPHSQREIGQFGYRSCADTFRQYQMAMFTHLGTAYVVFWI